MKYSVVINYNKVIKRIKEDFPTKSKTAKKYPRIFFLNIHAYRIELMTHIENSKY